MNRPIGMQTTGARRFSTADLYDDGPVDVAVINLQFRCFGKHACFHGRVETMRAADHFPIRNIVATKGDGRVLVVDADGDLTIGILGDRIASKAVEEGGAGVVVSGVIRDSQAIDVLPIGIRALGTTARRSSVGRDAQVGIDLDIGGVRVRSGDWLYADPGAVLISPRQLAI